MLDVRRAPVEELAELALADHAEGDVGRERGGREDRLEPVQGNQLPDEERVKRLGRVPAGAEQRLVRPDERDGDVVLLEAERPAEERRVRLGVGDDEIGAAERPVVDRAQHPCRGRARPEPGAVADERVVERDERVEHHGTAARDPPGGGHVEVPRVADDDDVGVVLASPGERALRAGDARQLREADRPVVAVPTPPGDAPRP